MLAVGFTPITCTDSLCEQIDRTVRVRRHYIHQDYIIQRYVYIDTD